MPIKWLVQNFKDIRVLDAYWLTLARPDNREIGFVGNSDLYDVLNLPKHLIHPGSEVVTALFNNWVRVAMLDCRLPSTATSDSYLVDTTLDIFVMHLYEQI